MSLPAFPLEYDGKTRVGVPNVNGYIFTQADVDRILEQCNASEHRVLVVPSYSSMRDGCVDLKDVVGVVWSARYDGVVKLTVKPLDNKVLWFESYPPKDFKLGGCFVPDDNMKIVAYALCPDEESE